MKSIELFPKEVRDENGEVCFLILADDKTIDDQLPEYREFVKSKQYTQKNPYWSTGRHAAPSDQVLKDNLRVSTTAKSTGKPNEFVLFNPNHKRPVPRVGPSKVAPKPWNLQPPSPPPQRVQKPAEKAAEIELKNAGNGASPLPKPTAHRLLRLPKNGHNYNKELAVKRTKQAIENAFNDNQPAWPDAPEGQQNSVRLAMGRPPLGTCPPRAKV